MTSLSSSSGASVPSSHELEFPSIWNAIDPNATVFSETFVADALRLAVELGQESNGMEILVTGSLHLVGAALRVLRPGYERKTAVKFTDDSRGQADDDPVESAATQLAEGSMYSAKSGVSSSDSNGMHDLETTNGSSCKSMIDVSS